MRHAEPGDDAVLPQREAGDDPGCAMGVRTSQRLCSQKEFQAVRENGERFFCGPFIVQCSCRDDKGEPRLGVIASRRVGSAVKRNRGKRLAREIFRRHAGLLPEGMDCVVVLRAKFDRYPFPELEDRFKNACECLIRRINQNCNQESGSGTEE
ncbi:MAG: ribonuclease P protein component [Opitutales bacterium]